MKQTQGGYQNEETKKYSLNESSDQKTPGKELNKMEKSNLTHADFKTLVIRVLKELSEDLNSIKMIQSEMKDTL